MSEEEYQEIDVNYLTLTKKIMNDELTKDELVESLNIPNIPVVQQTILKLIQKDINDEKVHKKLLEYSDCMDNKFKILGLCKIGHLAIYALEKLNFTEDFQTIYKKLSEEDKEQVMYLRKAFEQMK